jgi:tetratricopeptide (TPR) repeat protein
MCVFWPAAAYVHKGQLLMSSGKLQEALTDFEQALAIDPSSFIAQQESNKVRQLLQKNANPGASLPPSTESELDKRLERGDRPGGTGAHLADTDHLESDPGLEDGL